MERRVVRLVIERVGETVIGNAGGCVSELWGGERGRGVGGVLEPEMGLTKICMVSVTSGEEERDVGGEECIL